MSGRLCQEFPELNVSLLWVHVQMVEVPSKRDEVLANFRASCRGSLRRAPTVMVWVQTLRNLAKRGDYDTQQLIKRFNSENPKSCQLVGQKATAVKNLLENFPSQALAEVEQHIQKHSWALGCFSDDALSSKKLLPGFNHRLGSAGHWPNLGKITEKSCLMVIQHVVRRFASTPAAARHKITRAELEICAAQAAFVHNLGQLAISECPLDYAKLEQRWLDAFVNSELAVMLEVQTTMATKDSAIEPRGIKTLAALPLEFIGIDL